MNLTAQRIEQLRNQAGLSRPALSSALGFPKTAIEKFETGRQTPTHEQLQKLADHFHVSLGYLRGDSGENSLLDAWRDGPEEEQGYRPIAPRKQPKTAASAPSAPEGKGGSGTLLEAILSDRKFQQGVQEAVRAALRTPEVQEAIAKAVRRELERQR